MSTYAYVGCRTTKERNARGKGIKVYEISDDGTWLYKQLVENLVNPSFFCMDETENYLYSIHGDFHEISSFSINADNGELTYINTVSTEGENPVHLSVDKSNRWIYVANLQTGTVAVIPTNEDGSLSKLKRLYTIPGLKEGAISHPHQVVQDNSRNYLIVSCQGRKEGFGQIVVFKINHETGELTETCTVTSREIAEPRHFVFHPNNKYCYGVNEKDYSITYYNFDEGTGQLEPKQIVPTLPQTYTGDGWASGIVIEPAGKYVIVSNRKHDSITSFSINQETGMIAFADCVKTGGEQPRFIVMSKDGKKVVAANEVSDTIREFALDMDTGELSFTGNEIHTESPVCVIFKLKQNYIAQ